MKKKLNPTLVYVLSIIGLLCCCVAGLGVLLSAPAYFIASSKIKAAQLNPEEYEGDIKAMNTAKIVALVITIINAVYLIYNIYYISTGGFEESMQRYQEMMEQMQ
ncbi:CCC motif membrane protein [Lacinutrix sp. Hel_I_90]|uniref:CCC motif membrane protein n=1 Tax=Lacinutrix sp. Hel_I_90 TaxID=1249999 RepID=UPI0005C93B81|nr:CCC motif membrane protein [Lacinutrix sp. Hel_I_90]